jgi:zinc protease
VSILVEENHDLPLARLQVALRTGAADDPEPKDGLANFAAELMARGAGGRTRAELDAAFDALGTSLEVGVSHDGVQLEVTVLADRLPPAAALVADVLLRPSFPELEADKLRREVKAQLDELRDDDGQLARRNFGNALFGGHPYGRTILGSERSLAAITVEDARRWHTEAVRAGGVLFGFAGAVSQAEAEALVGRAFAGLPAGDVVLPPRPPLAWRPGMRLIVVDKPERTQSQILIGQPAPAWAHPDFAALSVATTAFGGTFTARLMHEVRSKRGLSYGASARVGHGRGPKAMVVHVFPSLTQTAETLELVLGLYRDWVTNGITDEELSFARGYLASSFAFSIATPEDRLELRSSVELCGVGDDYLSRYVERVRAVTRDDTARVMRDHLRGGDLDVCIVSTADELVPRLEAITRDWRVEVVPWDAL